MEERCRGLGSDTSRRVKWVKKLSEREVKQFTKISFIDDEGWVRRLGFNILAG